ncbi:MAG: lipoate--protein ligase [Negativicutes bacterium]|jgi:lipoate-protein ligase A
MKFIYNTNTDPYFNLAAEEHLMDSYSSEVFMLWRNAPCVVIGKNQNAYAEIDGAYVKRENIIVVRRNSGGGAVFHDFGNVNFTFISECNSGVQANFRKFTLPVIAALQNLGIAAEFSGRNDITVNGLKVSGNAQYYRGNRVLHHGTLLYSGNIGMLAAALKPNRHKLQAKGVSSVKSHVANIETFLAEKQPVEWFLQYLFQFCRNSQVDAEEYNFTAADLVGINHLRTTKYLSREWTYGKKPQFNYCVEQRFVGGIVELFLDVQNEIIVAAEIRGDFFGKCNVAGLEQILVGTRFERAAVKRELAGINLDEYLSGISADELVSLLP